jgi:hypothetical protein
LILFAFLASAFGATQIGFWDPEVHEAEFSGEGTPDLWQCGSVGSGPLSGFTGASACATLLSGNYSNNADSVLNLPDQEISGLELPMLRWMQWFSFEVGDVGQVEMFQSGVWEVVPPVYGYPGASEGYLGQAKFWAPVQLDLSGLTNLNQVRFRLNSDATVNDDGWYLDDFSVWDGDISPPKISGLSVLPDTEDLNLPYAVEATVEDNTESVAVVLFFSVNGAEVQSQNMVSNGAALFSGVIGGQEHDTLVDYWVEADDGFNLTIEPSEGVLSFRVRLPAPESLTGPGGVVHDTHADLIWTAPDTAHTVEGYRLYRGADLLVETEDLTAEVSLLGGGEDRFFVRAVYDQGEGDSSEELVLNSAVPTALSLNPDHVFQGDRVRSLLSGENLVFVQGELAVDFGEGVSVTDIDVRDVDSAVLEIRVDEDMPPGVYDLLVESGPNSVLLTGAMEVLDGEERPRVEELIPSLARQGANLLLEIRTSMPIGPVLSVDLGEGVYVKTIAQPEPNCLRVIAWIDLKAPLGERMVQVDDGQRVWTGQRFEVLDQAPPPVGCGTLGNKSSRWLLIPVGILVFRRRIRKRIG